MHSFTDILSHFWDQSRIKSWMPKPNPSYCMTIDSRGSRWMGYPMRKIFVSILALKFTGIFYLGKLRYDLNGGEKNFDSFIRKLSRKPRFVMKTNCLPDYFCPLKILVFWLKKKRENLSPHEMTRFMSILCLPFHCDNFWKTKPNYESRFCFPASEILCGFQSPLTKLEWQGYRILKGKSLGFVDPGVKLASGGLKKSGKG